MNSRGHGTVCVCVVHHRTGHMGLGPGYKSAIKIYVRRSRNRPEGVTSNECSSTPLALGTLL